LLSLSSQGIYLDVEHLGLQINGGLNSAPIGQMSPVTALSFLLVSLSFLILLLVSSGHPRWVVAAWVLVTLVILANYVFVLAYFVGLPLLYAENTIPPALPTSLAFLALGLALLARASAQAKPQGKTKAAGSTPVPSAIFLGFIILALSIVTIGYLYYRNFEQQFRTQMEYQLSAIADLKVNGLVSWRKERLADAEMLYQNPAFSERVAQYLEKPAEAQAQKQLQAWLDKFLVDGQYERASLLDTQGLERISAPASPAPVSQYLAALAAATLNSGQVTFADFHRDTPTGPIYLALMVPIFAGQEVGRPLGVLILRIDPHTYLYPFLQEWPAPSQSAETLLVRREGEHALFLNPLRFQPEAAINLRIPLEKTEILAVKAALGQTGVAQGLDYRGAEVIGLMRAVPDSPWLLVARMDLAEVYAPLQERLWQTIIFFGVLMITAGSGLVLAWRQQRLRYYRGQVGLTEALRESEKEFRLLAEAMPQIVWITRPDGWNIYFNQQWMDYTGLTLEESYGHGWNKPFHPDDQQRAWDAWQNATQNGATYALDCRLRRADGVYKWWLIRGVPVLDTDGTILKWFGTCTDIHELKEKEAALRETNEYLDNLFNYANAPIIVWDPQFRITRFNHAFETLTGRSAADVLGQPLKILFPPAQVKHSMELIQKTLRGERWEVVEISIQSLDGSIHTVLWNSATLFTADGKTPLATIAQGQEISERKQAEEKLIASEVRYRRLFEAARDGILILDATTGVIVDVNPFLVEMLGSPREEICGKELWELGFFKDIAENKANFLELQEKEYIRYEDLPLEMANGKKLHVEFVSNVYQVNHHKVVQCNIRDITARKRVELQLAEYSEHLEEMVDERTRELRSAQEQLVRQERLAMLGQLAGSIGHELRNPLGVISNAIYYLKMSQPEASDKVREYLDIIEKETRTSDKIVSDLLDFTRAKLADRELASVSELVNQTLERYPAPPSVQVVFEIPADLPKIYADLQHVAQILGNLVTNAFQSMISTSLDQRVLADSTSQVSNPWREQASSTGLPGGGKLTISAVVQGDLVGVAVQDTGPGISPENMDKLFQPLFTTKSKGIGLGLPVSKKLAEANGGKIEVESVVGLGSTFTVYLPVYDSADHFEPLPGRDKESK